MEAICMTYRLDDGSSQARKQDWHHFRIVISEYDRRIDWSFGGTDESRTLNVMSGA